MYIYIYITICICIYIYILYLLYIYTYIYIEFGLMTCGLYYMIFVEVFTNHTLAENTHFTNHIE